MVSSPPLIRMTPVGKPFHPDAHPHPGWLHGLIPFVVLLALTIPTAFSATLTASVDRKQMTLDETLILTLQLADSDTRLRAEGEQPNVDLTLLTGDFELGTPQERHRFNIRKNRGRSTSTLRVALFPRHTGRLRIPSFHVDRQKSEVIPIDVLAADPERSRSLFVKSGTSKNKLYVHETALLYLDLYQRIEVKTASLGGSPQLSPPSAAFARAGQGRRKETIDGIVYQVNRTAWAFAPSQAGDYLVQMPDVWVVTEAGEKRRLPFTDVSIEARPLPVGTPPGIIVGRPTIDTVPSASSVAAGSPVGLNIEIRAPILPDLLPVSPPDLNLPADIKIYQERPELHGPTIDQLGMPESVIRFPIHMFPEKTGRFQFPGLTLPWFDPADESIHLARSPEKVIEVTPPTHTPPETGLPPRSIQGNSHALPSRTRNWQLLSLMLLLLWAGTLGFAIRTYRRLAAGGHSVVDPEPKPRRRETDEVADTTQNPIPRLLEAMGTRTLEAGLRLWESRYGFDAKRRETVLAVQRFCYGHESGRHQGEQSDTADARRLNDAIDDLIKGLPARPPEDPATEDVWDPSSFTPTRQLSRRVKP